MPQLRRRWRDVRISSIGRLSRPRRASWTSRGAQPPARRCQLLDAAATARMALSLRRSIGRMSRAIGYAFFATAIGECALAWSDVGLTGVWLPEARPGAPAAQARAPARAEHARREPPATVAAAVDAMTRLLAGSARRSRRRGARPRRDRRFPAPRLRRRADDRSRPRRSATARSRVASAATRRRARSARRSAPIRFRSSSRAIASSPRRARWAASRRPAASPRSAACWRSRTLAPTVRPTCSTQPRRSREPRD